MKVLANLGLLLLLALSLGAVATAAIWTWFPEVVAKADSAWVWHHTGAIDERLVQLRELAGTDRGAAIAGLEDLAGDLRASLKGDRRYGTRRQVLRLLADLQFDAGDPEGARATGDELLDNYENDVGIQLWFARRLCDHESTRPRGLEVLEGLFARLPELGVVARAYHECALRAGDGALAADVLVRHLDRALRPEQSLEGTTGIWQVWWSQDGSWSGDRRVDVQALRYGDITAIGFELPSAASVLRLDPPVRSHLAYSTPRLGVFEGPQPIEIPIPSEGLKTHGMHLGPDSLLVAGSADPWVVIPLPAEHHDAPLRGRFVFVADRLPLWIGAAASTPAMRARAEALPAGSRARTALERARARYAEDQSIAAQLETER